MGRVGCVVVWLSLAAGAVALSTPSKAEDVALIEAPITAAPITDCEDQTAQSTCTFPPPPQLRAPTTATDDDKESHLTVSWRSLGAEYNITRYELKMSIDGQEAEIVFRGKATLFETESYSKYSVYDFSVRAINCASTSSASWSPVTHLEASPLVDAPRTPRLVNKTSTSVGLQWQPCVDDPASGVVVEYRKSNSPPPANARSSLWDDWQDGFSGHTLGTVITELAPNTLYWFRLAYEKGMSSGTWSKIMTVQTDSDVPSTPSITRTKWLDSSKTTLNVSWAIETDGGKPITNFELQMVSDLEEDFNSGFSGLAQWAVVKLTPGRSYTFRVSAANVLGHSKYSPLHAVACPARVPETPNAPRLVSKTKTSIKVRWQPPAFDGGQEIKRYVLEQGDGLGLAFRQVVQNMIFEHNSEGLLPNTHYRFRVFAINGVGNSSRSEVLTVHTGHQAQICPGGVDPSLSCFGHGECDAVSGKCSQCDAGWVLDDCSGKPCIHNCSSPAQGECDYGTGNCVCKETWLGADCSFRDLSHLCPKSCGRGTCSMSTGKCDCMDGFAGEACTERDCTMHNQCSGHGECFAVGACRCDEGYIGLDCARPSCASQTDCSGHGECVAPDQCKCLDAYLGSDCAHSLCDGECSNRGLCIGKNKCQCDDGYTGVQCERPACPNDCSGNGACVDPGQCVCKDGWAGVDCSTALCFKVSGCSGRGKCVAPDTCSCDPGWGGPSCSEFRCAKDCNNQGQCVGPLNCVCNPGWNGAACDEPDCDLVDECSGNGHCVSPNNCTCTIGWTGKMCAEAMCDRVKFCSGHGRCIFPQVCTCNDGFGGAECEQRTKPTNSLAFNRAIDSMDFARPLLNNLRAYTVQGWFNISQTGLRANLVSQRNVFELYATRKFSAAQKPELDESGKPFNPIVINCEATTPFGKLELSRQVLFEANTFHHIAVSVSVKNGMILFVDGGEVARRGVPTVQPDTATLGSSDFTTTSAGGIVDSTTSSLLPPQIVVAALQVWSSARVLTDVQKSMTAGDAEADYSTTDNLVGFWKFDDLFGSYAGDAGPKKFTARLVGEPEFRLSYIPQITAPSPPVMVEHEVLSPTSIRVMWEAPEKDGGATVQAYRLERSLDFTKFDAIYEGADLEFEVTALSKSRAYAFRVSAANFAGMSKFSNVSYLITTAGPPLAPKFAPKLEAATETSLDFSWVRAKCNGSLVTNYTAEVTDSRGVVRRLGAHVDIDSPRRVKVSGLLPGKDYQVRVRAANKQGEGTWSDSTTMHTLAAVPNAPQWGHINSTARSVTLRWSTPANNGDAVRRFRVERAVSRMRTISSLAAAPPQPLSPNQRRQRANLHRALQHASSFAQVDAQAPAPPKWVQLGVTSGLMLEFVDATASPATVYVYRIRAENDAGVGSWTEVFVTTDSAVPESPTNLELSSVTSTAAVVSWRRPAANGPAIFSYKAEIALLGDHPEWKLIYEGDHLSSTVSNLKPGTDYFVRVTARNCKGWGPSSPPAILKTAAVKPNTPPTFLVRKVAPRAIVYSWTVPKGNGYDSLTFTLQMRAQNLPFTEVYTGAAANTTIRGLLPATDYEARVAAVSMAGLSVFSESVQVRTLPAVPDKPPRLVVTDTRATLISVAWGEPASNGLEITDYEVYCGESSADELHRVFTGRALSVVVRELKPATRYRVRVRALNKAGMGDYSEVETVTSSSLPLTPFPPTVSSKTETSIALAWSKHNLTRILPLPPVAQWELQVFAPAHAVNHTHIETALANDNNFQIVYKGPLAHFNVTDLLPNSSHYFRVRALNAFGVGEFSSPVAVSVSNANARPDSPAHIKMWRSPDEVALHLQWTPQGVDDNRNAILEYVVERTQGFPWDVSLDGSVQGALQSPWAEDTRVDRLRGDAANGLIFVEAYRGDKAKTSIIGLQAGHSYGIRVRTVNVLGESLPSALVVFHTLPGAPDTPLAPELVAASATELRVEWDRPADGGADIQAYQIVLDGKFVNVPDAKRTFVAKNLLPGSTHKLAVIASNALGSSTSEEVQFSTLMGAPFRPPKPLVSASPGVVEVDVRWAQALPAGAPVTGYTLEMSSPASPHYVPIVSNALVFSTHIAKNIIPGQQHMLRLFAHSSSGVSEPSEVAIFFGPTILPNKPVAPRIQGLTATSALLVWDADWTSGPTEHELRVGADAASMKIVSEGLGSQFLLADLKPNTRLIAQLRLRNGKGPGPWSDEVVFTTETLCVGDDGAVCSGRGECVEGKCVCFKRYVGPRCEAALDMATCSLFGAGHVITFDGLAYTTHAVGEHVVFTGGDALGNYTGQNTKVSVRAHWRPVEFDYPNMTAIDSVAIEVDGHVLTLSTSRRPMRASNNLYVRLDCGASVGVDIRKAFEKGLDIENSDFHVRYDFARRFIVSVRGSHNRIVVQPWLYQERWFLNAHVVATAPRMSMIRGVCGVFAAHDGAPVLQAQVPTKIPGDLVSPTWFDQWMPTTGATNITQCVELENPAFDTTPPVAVPKGDASPSNDVATADASILMLLEADASPIVTPADSWCPSRVLPLARGLCSGTQVHPFVFAACVWDSCASQGSDRLLSAHGDARRTIAALNDAVNSQKDTWDEEEERAADDGSLTNGQLPLAVCPQ